MAIWGAILEQVTRSEEKCNAPSTRPRLALDVYALDDYGFICVAGPDAEKFLQGQATCDFKRLQIGDLLLGAHCNAKGRMISSFIAAQQGGEIWLRLHSSILEIALAAFKKYSVFSKVTLRLATDAEALAIAGPGALEWAQREFNIALNPNKFSDLGHGSLLCHHPDLIEIRGTHTFIAAAIAKFTAEPAFIAKRQWDGVLVQRAWPEIRAESSEVYIPQMLNFHVLDGVSFKKGCYTGQEIVARMQYLGKLKKHLVIGSVANPVNAINIGDPLFTDAGHQGEIVLQATYDDRIEFLAVLNDTVAGSNTVFLGAEPSAKIVWQALPYAIP